MAGAIATRNNNAAAAQSASLATWLNTETVKRKFHDVLDKSASGFISSLLSLVSSNKMLQQADPKTVVAAAMTAATLKLPINPNLGFAYIVPYNNKVDGRKAVQAQFQLGYKGIIQLAMRSGQYRTINASVIHEGEVEDIDCITGQIVRGKRTGDTVTGYAAYFELVNGFSKTLYMTAEDMRRHALEYSQSYAYDVRNGKKASVWSKNFDAMALKTVLKLLISKYGIMSVDMQSQSMAMALESDQTVVQKVGESYAYVDNGGGEYAPEEAAEELPMDEQETAEAATPAAEEQETSAGGDGADIGEAALG